MKILLIEDDREAASYLMQALDECGHVTHHASDGETGFAMASAIDYDVLIVDRMPKQVRHDDIYSYPWHLALIIGLFQMLSLVPGVSRSGSTVVGAMLFGASKRSAAEFTFFIALPIMAGAFGYDLYKSRELIDLSLGLNIAIGFAASFVVGALVVKYLLDFVSRHGFAPFAWWRIIVGGAGLVTILAFGL